MHSLPLFLRLVGQPVILIGMGEAADAKRRLIERAGGIAIPADDSRAAAARIAFVALAEPEETAATLKAAGKLVNVVDRPELCDFTTPAIVDRDPVLIAISTGGASSGLAAALRQRLESLLPARLGGLAEALNAARAAMRARWPDAGARRRALSRALAPGGMLDPMIAIYDIDEWLESGIDAPTAIYRCIHLASDDPDLLSLGDARSLGMADCILHPPGTPAAILDRARADAIRIKASSDAPWPEGQGGLVVRIMMAPG
jgi:uroporphyrin-III C-methyltransferase / precorrin-2 dehydrogenase / sirohydrochlorin ferrochelatase